MIRIQEKIETVKRPVKILQFGEGNFLRAFADWMIDIANEKTNFNGSAVLVQPLEKGMADMINSQNGLYTTILRGIQNGQTVSDKRAINSVTECLNPYSDWEKYMGLSTESSLRFVISNTTEAGIAWADGTAITDKPASSFPAKVTQFLYSRYRFFNGDTTKGLVFIPCELIDKNGDHLKEYVLRHAQEWKLEAEFTQWINSACSFCNSLVDRIVPGYPAQEADAIQKELGYEDSLLCAAEIFHLWVIESGKDFSDELPLAKAGLNVIWTKDMSFYRTRKVRILNGTHTMFVPAAYLMGVETVEDSLKDPDISLFIKKGLFEEIIPSMDGDTKALEEYAGDVLERFANPYIRHLLISITLNSVSKFKTRDLPSLTSFMEKKGRVPLRLALSMAALIYFYLTKTEANDDPAILAEFKTLRQKYPVIGIEESKAVCTAVLSNTQWWGEDLTERKGLCDEVSTLLLSIEKNGIRNTIKDVNKAQ